MNQPFLNATLELFKIAIKEIFLTKSWAKYPHYSSGSLIDKVGLSNKFLQNFSRFNLNSCDQTTKKWCVHQ